MLKILPAHIYNLIAAGEVIKRPASVVKELLENSADAGATSITLILNDYGKTLIQVIDNGCGMTSEEASICFLSHATSKIDKVEDLQTLMTYGFRGEALASIAACSDVTLKTRREGEETGTLLHIAASNQDEAEEIACPVGCNIAVRNIFYNIPARRKFLKSDNAEYRRIMQEFTRVALTKLDADFKLIHNSKEVMLLKAGRNLKQRISDILELPAIKQLVDVGVDTTMVKIHGFISTPKTAKKSQSNQFLFVNGRFFKSPIMYRSILNGYSGLIPDGYSPAFFIYFEVKSDELDVNISPDKTEVKFENEQVIAQILEASVKEAIGKNAFAPMIDFDTEGVPPAIASSDGFYMTKGEKESFRRGGLKMPKVDYNPLFNPFDEEKNPPSPMPSPSQESGMLFDSSAEEAPMQILSLDNKSVVLASGDGGLTVLNLERAQAKIFYERYLASLVNGENKIQEALFPTTVDLSVAEYEILTSNIELLKDLGFEIRKFGKECIVVCGTPSDFSSDKFSIEECMSELAHLLENKEFIANLNVEVKKKFALEIVRHTSFKPKYSLTASDAYSILSALSKLPDSTICPTGGYCYITIPKDEIVKRML